MGGPPPECRTTNSEAIKLEPDAPHFPLHLTGAADRDERRPLTVPETTPGHDPNTHRAARKCLYKGGGAS